MATYELEDFGGESGGVVNCLDAYNEAMGSLATDAGGALILRAGESYLVDGSTDPLPPKSAIVGLCSGLITNTDESLIKIPYTSEDCLVRGIRITGSNAGDSQNGIMSGALGAERSPARLTLDDIWVEGLYRGFLFAGPNSGSFSGPSIINCRAKDCFYGFYSTESAEYLKYLGCEVTDCDEIDGAGVYIGSGNVTWNGTANFNYYGIYLATGANDAHGSVSGNVNHNGFAVYAEAITNGFRFSNANIFAGKIKLVGSTGVAFSSSRIDVAEYILDASQGTVFADSCTFSNGYGNTVTESNGSATQWGHGKMTDGSTPSWLADRIQVSFTFAADENEALSAQASQADLIEVEDGVTTEARDLTSQRAPNLGESILIANRNTYPVNFFFVTGDGVAIPPAMTCNVGCVDGVNAACLSMADNVAETVARSGGATFDPETLEWSGVWKAPYEGIPWVGTASEGTSEGKDLTVSGSNPSVGAPQNGQYPASFDGSSMGLAGAYPNQTADIFLDASTFTIALVVKPSNPGSASSNAYSENMLCGLGNGNFGITYTASGVRVFMYNGSSYVATGYVELTEDEWHLIVVALDSGTLSISVDGGTPETVSAGGSLAGVDSTSWLVGLGFNGQRTESNMLEVRTAKSVVGSTDLTSYRTGYVNPTYALDL